MSDTYIPGLVQLDDLAKLHLLASEIIHDAVLPILAQEKRVIWLSFQWSNDEARNSFSCTARFYKPEKLCVEIYSDLQAPTEVSGKPGFRLTELHEEQNLSGNYQFPSGFKQKDRVITTLGAVIISTMTPHGIQPKFLPVRIAQKHRGRCAAWLRIIPPSYEMPRP